MIGKIPNLRWWIASLLFSATVINFLNRLAIAVLGPTMTVQLHLSASKFAMLTTSFLLAAWFQFASVLWLSGYAIAELQ